MHEVIVKFVNNLAVPRNQLKWIVNGGIRNLERKLDGNTETTHLKYRMPACQQHAKH